MRKKIKSFDGVHIMYEITSKSPYYLIFVHGAGGNLTAWKSERRYFENKGFSTIALDIRGHGLSERPLLYSDYKIENFAKDINAIVNAEKIKKFVIVGHCFGGMITITYNRLFPKKANGYVLIDTTFKAPQQLKVFKHHPFLIHVINQIFENEELRTKHFSQLDYKKYKGTGDFYIPRLFQDIIHTSFKSWFFSYEIISGYNGISSLKSMNKPVLILEGLKDEIFKPEIANKIHNLVKSSKIEYIPNANHVLVMNNVIPVEHAIYKYLNVMSSHLKIPSSLLQN